MIIIRERWWWTTTKNKNVELKRLIYNILFHTHVPSACVYEKKNASILCSFYKYFHSVMIFFFRLNKLKSNNKIQNGFKYLLVFHVGENSGLLTMRTTSSNNKLGFHGTKKSRNYEEKWNITTFLFCSGNKQHHTRYVWHNTKYNNYENRYSVVVESWLHEECSEISIYVHCAYYSSYFSFVYATFWIIVMSIRRKEAEHTWKIQERINFRVETCVKCHWVVSKSME